MHARTHARTRARAQVIGLVFVLIFAVLGRQLFSERAPGSFGTFDVSFVTLFGAVSTLEQWPDDLPIVVASDTAEVGSFAHVCVLFSERVMTCYV